MTNRIEQLIEAKLFHQFVVVVAGLETSPSLMAQHAGTPLHWLDSLVLGVFISEAFLKMAAHGRRP